MPGWLTETPPRSRGGEYGYRAPTNDRQIKLDSLRTYPTPPREPSKATPMDKHRFSLEFPSAPTTRDRAKQRATFDPSTAYATPPRELSNVNYINATGPKMDPMEEHRFSLGFPFAPTTPTRTNKPRASEPSPVTYARPSSSRRFSSAYPSPFSTPNGREGIKLMDSAFEHLPVEFKYTHSPRPPTKLAKNSSAASLTISRAFGAPLQDTTNSQPSQLPKRKAHGGNQPTAFTPMATDMTQASSPAPMGRSKIPTIRNFGEDSDSVDVFGPTLQLSATHFSNVNSTSRSNAVSSTSSKPKSIRYGPVARKTRTKQVDTSVDEYLEEDNNNSFFANGHALKLYQATDLQRLIAREHGESVCNYDSFNETGFILAYEMGLGKTAMSIALIKSNPPPGDFEGVPATLVVVPNQGIMGHWVEEIKKFSPKLSVCYYNSIKAKLNPDVDVVLCTYPQLRLQHTDISEEGQVKKYGRAPLYDHYWYRVITDEAHYYCNPSTKVAASVWGLRKLHGLVLTGTPARNSLLDYYPLLRFLEVVYLRLDQLPIYQRKVYSKRQKGPIRDPKARAIFDTLMTSFTIFRSKNDSGSELPRTDKVVEVILTPKERLVYDAVHDSKLHPFARMTRLRQVCDHPKLLLTAFSEDFKLEGIDAEEECLIERPAPVELGPISDSANEALRELTEESYVSSKIDAMMDILENIEGGQKTIIFTHFTSVFFAIANALEEVGIEWAEYTGGMTAKEQKESLDRIKEDDITVLVVSIKAGGTGLCITSCNNVILLEPWWNPYFEEQAISRVHREGQTLPVNVYRLVTTDTIEESIIVTQKQKRAMVDSVNGAGCGVGHLDTATIKKWLNGP